VQSSDYLEEKLTLQEDAPVSFFSGGKKVELNPNVIPGGRSQIVQLRVVQFEVYSSVCCSCDFFERVAIFCRHIMDIFHLLDKSMVDV
jgi:hypothetical protein